MRVKRFLAVSIAMVHMAAVIAVIVIIGINSETVLGRGHPIFTGELERGATIRVLENDTAISQGFFSELLTAFNEEFAEYGITAVDANQDQFIDLEQAGPFGFGSCVIFQANDRIMRFADGGHIFDLPIEELAVYEYIDYNAWDAFRAELYDIVLDDRGYPVLDDNGQPILESREMVLGVPVKIQAPVIYYRRSLVDPEVLTSWRNIYLFNRRVNAGQYPGIQRGYIRSMVDPYFNFKYLLSYGAYIFGDNNTDPTSIGLSRNGSERGVGVMRQLANSMDSRVSGDDLTPLIYEQLARGNFAMSMTTPDVYTLFIDALMRTGFSREAAVAELGVAPIPPLPYCGDLTNPNATLIPTISMGGVNGYAISAYTNYPNAAFAFIDFATSFDMIRRRNELLGIVPARYDVAYEVGGISPIVGNALAEGQILVMPSIREMAQVWGPVRTFFMDVSLDAFRSFSLLATPAQQQARLRTLDDTIYRAIWTF